MNSIITNEEKFKVFDNLKGYYLKISIINDKLYIILYNIDSLDGIKYKADYNLNEMYSLCDLLKTFKSIEDIYNALIQLIEKKRCEIIKKGDDITFYISISDILNNIKKIAFEFKKEKNDNIEFIKILINEIQKMKNIIKIIDQLKEENKKIKLELEKLKNDIISNNKTTLEEFNKEFNLKINDNNIEVLNLSDKNYDNKIIDSLYKIELTNIKELKLDYNNINDIKSLSKVKFVNLQILLLKKNKISDISVLEKVNFTNLKILNLGNNNIVNISPLTNANFKKLEKLNLSCNKKLSDITALQHVDFPQLKELSLFQCNINNIKPLSNAKFQNLEYLSLNSNKISDISILGQVNFKKLQKLYLNFNNINNITPLKNDNFPKLELLYLVQNQQIDTIKYSEIIDFLRAKIKDFQI